MTRHVRKMAVVTLVFALVFSSLGIAMASPSDVIGTRFADSVDYLVGLGVISGYPDGTFRPAVTISRAEACKIIVLMTQGDAVIADLLRGANPFIDVPGSHWASGFIALAKNEGIVNGYPDGSFRPEATVSYAEYVKMLVEAAGLSPIPGYTWPANYVSAALTAGMLAGVPSFESGAPAVRGDCAIMTAFTIQEVPNPANGMTLAHSVFGLGASSITVTPATGFVPVGGSLPLIATVKDLEGQVLSDVTVTWTTSDPAKSAVSTEGLFLASYPGSYTVTAKYGGATGTATVGVFGVAYALKATPAVQTVAANGATVAEIVVEVVDLGGNRVANNDEIEITMAHEDNNGAVELGDTVKTVEDGVAVFEVTAKTSDGVTDELVFSAGTLGETSAQITTVDQIATGLTIEADPSELMANDVDYGDVVVTVVDQSGQTMLSGTYEVTFAISGPGLLEGSTEDIAVGTIAGQAIVEVSSEKGMEGTFTITASSPGLGTVQAAVTTYFAGTAKALKATVDDGLGESGATDMKVTVTIVDQNGRPTERGTSTTVIFESEDGDWNSFGPLVIPAGVTHASETFGGDKAGTFTVTASDEDEDLTSTSFQVTVAPGDPDEIVITPDADPVILLPIAQPTVTLTVQVVDTFGNDLPQAGIEVTFSADQSVTGKGSATFAPSDKVKTDSLGRASVTMTAQAYVGALYTVTATTSFDSVQTASQGIRITDTVPTSLTITTENDGAKVTTVAADSGEVIDGTIVVFDANDNPIDGGYDVKIAFSNEGKHVNVLGGVLEDPDEAGVYWGVTDSLGEVDFVFEGALAGSFTITATAVNSPTQVSVSRSFRTKVGTVPVGYMITFADGTKAEDVDYEAEQVLALRVSLVDNGGNPMVAPTDTLVDLTADNGTAQYRATSTGTEITVIMIEGGRSYKSVYYVDSVAGTGVDLYDDAHE